MYSLGNDDVVIDLYRKQNETVVSLKTDGTDRH